MSLAGGWQDGAPPRGRYWLCRFLGVATADLFHRLQLSRVEGRGDGRISPFTSDSGRTSVEGTSQTLWSIDGKSSLYVIPVP